MSAALRYRHIGRIRERERTILELWLEALARSHHGTSRLGGEGFNVRKSVVGKWLTADYAAKRRILDGSFEGSSFVFGFLKVAPVCQSDG
jgi:hypothetical protein